MAVVLTIIGILVFFARDPARELDPGAARVRARRDLPPRAPDRPEGAGPDLPDPDHRQDGAGRPAHGDAQHPAAGGDHARQRARLGERRLLLPRRERRTTRSCRSRTSCWRPRRSRRRRCARCSAAPSSTRCCPSATASTTSSSGSSTSRPSRGASRSRRSRSRTSRSRRRCSARWRARPRPSASGARRSSPPRASSRPSDKLAQAAATIGKHPVAIQLRFLQTLLEVGSERNSTTIFPRADRPLQAVPRGDAARHAAPARRPSLSGRRPSFGSTRSRG